MENKNKYVSAISTGIISILYITIILFGGFVFPILYLLCDISWIQIICITYAVLYAVATILGGRLIPYIIIFFINFFTLKLQGHSNCLLTAFVEVPLMVSTYCLITGYFKRKNQNDHV